MHRRLAAGVAAAALLVAVGPAPLHLGSAAAAAGATRSGAAPASDPGAPPTGPAAPGPPQAKAWLVADADTGAIVASFNEHGLLRPASVAKILTGLLAVDLLAPDSTVPVGPDAEGTEAAKINMKAGQAWPLTDTLHSLLMVSANDAAVALADKLAGSEAGFGALAARATTALGTVDHPVFNDPAGLDDSFSFGGGDQVSAYDMAVITRAAMSLPDIRAVVATPLYHFVGPDGVHHTLHNHNKLLLWDPTVIGVKPGFTRQAQETLVVEATRNGRTMLVVELGSTPPAMYSGAEGLLAQGFATPVSGESGLEQLPAVNVSNLAAAPAPAPVVSRHRGALPATSATVHQAPRILSPGRALVLMVVSLAVALVVRRRRVVLRRRRRSRPSRTGATLPPELELLRGSPGYGAGVFFDQDQDDPRNRSAASMQR